VDTLACLPYHERHVGLGQMDAEEAAAVVLGAHQAHMLGLEHDAGEEVAQECFVCTHMKIVARY
jgi:hypothetical protein